MGVTHQFWVGWFCKLSLIPFFDNELHAKALELLCYDETV